MYTNLERANVKGTQKKAISPTYHRIPSVIQLVKINEFALFDIENILIIQSHMSVPPSPEILKSFQLFCGERDVANDREIVDAFTEFQNIRFVHKGESKGVFRTLRSNEVADPDIHMEHCFEEGHRENKIIGKHFQLGFDSVAIFKKRGRTDYGLVKVWQKHGQNDYDEVPYEDSTLQQISFTKIITNEVSTCTFVTLMDREESFVVVMHLDLRDEVPVNMIKAALTTAGIQVPDETKMFISKVEGEAEQKKLDTVRRELHHPSSSFNPGMYVLDRGIVTEYMGQQHDSIGVAFTEGGPVISGTSGKGREKAEDELRSFLSETNNEKNFIEQIKCFPADAQEIINKLLRKNKYSYYRSHPDELIQPILHCFDKTEFILPLRYVL